jgi:hypothetical protein
LEGNIGGNYTANTLVWSQVSGPNTALISSTTSLSPTVSGLITGTYVFRITATCQIGGNATDNVNVTVLAGATGVAPSFINAGCYTPGSTINLTGTAPVGHTLNWSVANNSAPAAGSFNGAVLSSVTGNNPTLQFAAPPAAWCAPSYSTANINVKSTNTASGCSVTNSFAVYYIFRPPAVNAVADPAQVCGTCVNLIGSCQQDGAGVWTVISNPAGAPAVSFSPNNTSSVARACNLVPGNYTFRWTVSGASCTNGNASVSITVNPPAIVTTPIANSKRFCPGTLPSIVSLEGNVQNPGETVLWTQVSGPAVTINNPTSPYAQAVGLTAAGAPYIFKYTISGGGCFLSDTMMISVTKALGYQPTNYGACGNPTPTFISRPIGSIPFDHSDSVLVSIIYESGPATNLQLLFQADMMTQSGSPAGISYYSPYYNITRGGTGTHAFKATTLWPNYNQLDASIYFWFFTNNNIPSCSYLLPGLYRFRVQFKDHCGTYTSNAWDMTVSSTGNFNAGSDQMLSCGTITTTLAANVQSCEMTPYWTTISKPAAAPDPISIGNMYNTNASLSGLQNGTYIFKWNSSSSGWGCPVNSDSVRVTVSTTPPAAPVITGGGSFCRLTPVSVTGALNNDALNGTWTVTTSPLGGAYSISPSVNSPNIIFTPSTVSTTYTLRWTVVNGCGTNFGTTNIVTGSTTATIPNITTADNCFSYTSLGFGTLTATGAGGTWTSNNANYTLTTPSALSTTVSPSSFSNSLGNVVFYYTITGACGTIRDSVSFGAFQTPSLPTDNFCNIASFPTAQVLTLTNLLPYSNYVINGVSGPGIATVSPMSFIPTGTTQNITLNASQAGQYAINILQRAGTCNQTTSYTVQLSGPPPLALAGPDINLCGSTNFVNLNAQPNPLGTNGGTWSIQTINNGFAPTFSNAGSPVSTVTFNNGGGDVLLRWSVTGNNPGCVATNTDYLRIRYVPTANAGRDDFTCYNASSSPAAIVLNANNHTAGVGLWTIVSQPSGSAAVFINPNLPNTTISNMINGVYVLRWTITDPAGNCPPTFDDVNILVYVGCSIVPLELTSIQANWENRDGKITWKIENDDYRNKYIIERASNLQGMFSAAGNLDYNTDASGSYTFYDRNAFSLASKYIYYRVKTLDHNNQVLYSKIVLLRTENEDQFSVYPNLVKKGESINIYSSRNEEKYSYKLVNMQGATIAEKTNITNRPFSISTEKMTPGSYILQLFTNQQTAAFKIVVQ